jgi:hypothetical protein
MHRIARTCARAGSGTRPRSSRSPPRRQRAADRLSAPGGNPCASTAGGGKPGAVQAGEREAPTAAVKPGKDCKVEFAGISITFPCAD